MNPRSSQRTSSWCGAFSRFTLTLFHAIPFFSTPTHKCTNTNTQPPREGQQDMHKEYTDLTASLRIPLDSPRVLQMWHFCPPPHQRPHHLLSVATKGSIEWHETCRCLCRRPFCPPPGNELVAPAVASAAQAGPRSLRWYKTGAMCT